MTYDLRSSQVIVAAATRAVDFSMNKSWAPARVIQRKVKACVLLFGQRHGWESPSEINGIVNRI